MTEGFARRIPEDRVASLLTRIATPPNRRQQAVEGDLPGEFDFWFDGGVCKQHTGSAHYDFADGAEAFLDLLSAAARRW